MNISQLLGSVQVIERKPGEWVVIRVTYAVLAGTTMHREVAEAMAERIRLMDRQEGPNPEGE